MGRGIILLGVISVLLSGCASVISKEALQGVQREIGFDAIVRNPKAFRERSVILGGDILETKPLSRRTEILVLQRALGTRDKPNPESVSLGRFIVSAPGFLDPEIYRSGRLVTIVGTITGQETRPLGEIEYTYPLIEKREIYLWPVEETGRQPRFFFGLGVGKSF